MKSFFNLIYIFILFYVSNIALGIYAPKFYDTIYTDIVMQTRSIRVASSMMKKPYSMFFFKPEDSDSTGVTTYNTDKAFDGYTYFTTAGKNETVLIDMQGNVVHSWKIDLEKEIPDRIDPTPEHNKILLRSTLDPVSGTAYLLPYQETLMLPKYPGMLAVDSQSQLVWHNELETHHNIKINPADGKIYALTTTMLPETDPDFPHLPPPILDEGIGIFERDGTFIKNIRFWDVFKNSSLRLIMQRNRTTPSDVDLPPGDFFHVNSFAFVPEAAIGKAPMLQRGHIMLSFRNHDLLVMLNPETEEITWASYGPWKGQHDPQILDDGSVLLFDNLGDLNGTGASRVLNIDLNNLAILWQFQGNNLETPLYSFHSSSVQQLANGNVLITSTEQGRILEVTRDQELVWEYWIPERYTDPETGIKLVPSVASAVRFTRDELEFMNE